jgi:hypothetical protein
VAMRRRGIRRKMVLCYLDRRRPRRTTVGSNELSGLELSRRGNAATICEIGVLI